MKFLLIITSFIAIACQPKKTISAEQSTTNENKVEKSVVVDETNISGTSKDSTFKNSEGIKSELQSVDTLKKSLDKEEPFIEADASFQWNANQKLEKLLKYYGKNIPDYYGGAFINDKGNLVINIKGNLQKGKSEISKIVGTENILFQSAKHSLNELNRIMDVINKSFENPAKKPYTKNIMTAGSYEDKGYVEVGLKDNSPEKQKEFRQYIIDSPLLKFVKSGPIVLQ